MARMNGNKDKILYPEESYQIVGCAMEVLNYLGPGSLEKIYENALVKEFRLRKIPYSQQKQFSVEYKGEVVGIHTPDLIVFDKIVADPKTAEAITDEHRAVMLSYLRVTKCTLGIYLNFKRSKLEVTRIVLENH
jgi:GxxExxY protein